MQESPRQRQRDGTSRLRLCILTPLSILLAGFLVYILFRFSGVSLADIVEGLLTLPLGSVLAYAALTFASQMAGARKWQMIVKALGGEQKPSAGYLFYLASTTVAGAFSWFLGIQVSSVLVGGLSLKMSGQGSVTKGAVTATAMQALHGYVILLFLPSALLVMFTDAPAWVWLSLALIVLAVGLGAALHGGERAARAGLVLLQRVRWSRVAAIRNGIEQGMESGIYHPRLLASLFLLSVVGLSMLAVRNLVMLTALGIGMGLLRTFAATVIAQSSLVIPLTPGNFGVLEWTWSGLLHALGVPLDAAARFAIMCRVVTGVSGYATLIISGGLHFAATRLARRRNAAHQVASK